MFTSPGETYVVPGTAYSSIAVGVETHAMAAVLLNRLMAGGRCVGWAVLGDTAALLLLSFSQDQQRHQTAAHDRDAHDSTRTSMFDTSTWYQVPGTSYQVSVFDSRCCTIRSISLR